MKAETLFWTPDAGWSEPGKALAGAQLALYFGARERIAGGGRFAELQRMFPRAAIVGCSTGGQIFAGDVSDELVTALVLEFDATGIAVIEENVADQQGSFAAGSTLGARLMRPDLKAIFVLSDGIHVNGSDLVAGIVAAVGRSVTVTGGMAGDGTRFQETLIGAGGVPCPHRVAAIGFYGRAISIGHGSAGGWDEFGPKRKVSRSEGNLLFTLDGQPALDLYERYLGEEAEGLPATALLFPLLVADPAHPGHSVIRAVLGINRDDRSLFIGGNIPEGWTAQLMRGHFDNLAEGAAAAARQAAIQHPAERSDVAAILVSCIGRRILMGQTVVDEITSAAANLGDSVRQIGFYSYGEISPHAVSGVCELHNQMMTVTTIAEAGAI